MLGDHAAHARAEQMKALDLQAAHQLQSIAGHVAIVVDDGVATGATTRAALGAVRMRQPSALVLAVPVASTDTVERLRREVDDLVCLEAHSQFGAIGYYYGDFTQVDDETVATLLARHPVAPDSADGGGRS